MILVLNVGAAIRLALMDCRQVVTTHVREIKMKFVADVGPTLFIQRNVLKVNKPHIFVLFLSCQLKNEFHVLSKILAYIGCFSSNFPLLTSLTQSMVTSINMGSIRTQNSINSKTMTISFCISVCSRFNLQYAGLFLRYMLYSI